MKLILGIVLSMVLLIGLAQYVYADLIIYQVEANPKGTDSGNEWLTVLNTGSQETLNDYIVKSTHGRIATKSIPDITLNNCEYYKVSFPKQAIDNRDETMKLIKSGKTVYETPTLKDTKNDDRVWTNPDGSVCSNPNQVFPVKITLQPKPEPKITVEPQPKITQPLEERTVYEKIPTQSRISELEKENRELKQIILNLKSQLKSIMAFLNNFDGY